MNGKNEPPADRRDEPDAIRQPERLNQIERRLKQARPRPPNLDAAALEQIARSALAGSTGAQPASPMTVRPRGHQWRRPSRSLAAVASAWTCGAIVGSLATMLLMSRIGSNGAAVGPAVHNEDRLSLPTASREVPYAVAPPLERRDATRARNAMPPDKDALALAMLIDPSGSSPWWNGTESSPLRAGMHFAKDTRAAPDVLPSATPTAKPTPPDNGARQAKTPKKSEAAPACPEITRERILDDLLREMSNAVL